MIGMAGPPNTTPVQMEMYSKQVYHFVKTLPEYAHIIQFDGFGGVLNQGFAPILGHGEDTVDFSGQLSTIGHSGATVTIQAYGVDVLGQQGSIVSRQIHIE